MEGIRSGAVELLGDQPEIGGTTRFEHADHHPVFLAHAPHDLPDRVELAQLTGDVTLDVLEFFLLGAGVEGQWATFVISAIHLRQLAPSGSEKALADIVVPLHRIEDPYRGLRRDDAIGQRTDGLLIFVQLHACVHRFPAGADIGLDGILRMFARLVQRNSRGR